MALIALCSLAWADPTVPPPAEDSATEETAAEEVEVEGASSPADQAPGVVTLPIDETIPAGLDVAGLLERAPGAVVQRLGGIGDFATVSMRGASPRHADVVFDGISLNPDGSAAVNLSEFPLSVLERVDVYRSSAPMTLGGTGLGGVVHLVPRDGNELDFLAGYGSQDTVKAAATVARAGSMDGLLSADFLWSQGDFLYFEGGTPWSIVDDGWRIRENNDKLQVHGLGRLAGGRVVRWRLVDDLVTRDQGIPGPAEISTPTTRMAVQRNLAGAAVSGQAGPVAIGTQLSEVVRHERLDDSDASVAFVPTLTDTWQTGTTGALTASVAPSRHLTATLLGQARYEHLGRDDLLERVELPSHERWIFRTGAEALGHFAHDRLRLSTGLQAVSLSQEASLPLVVALPRGTIQLVPAEGLDTHVSAGSAFRPPDFTELYGNEGRIVGNEELNPERGWFVEAGVGALGERWSLRLDAHWTRRHELIAYVMNARGQAIAQNLGESRISGVETVLWTHPAPAFELLVNATVSDSRNLDPSLAYYWRRLPMIPLLAVHARPTVHVGYFSGGYTLDASSPTYWDSTNFFRSPPRVFHGIWLRAKPILRGPSVELDVFNLLNHMSERVPADPLFRSFNAHDVRQSITDFFGYPLPGITFFLSVRWAPPLRA